MGGRTATDQVAAVSARGLSHRARVASMVETGRAV